MSTVSTLAAPSADAAREAAQTEALTRLYSGQDLTRAEIRALFARLMSGELPDTTIAAMLVALRVKGETPEELIGAAQALREHDAPFERPDYPFADTCGTGGDGAGTINVSTATGFVCAAAGLPIVKHGNRSVTSRCGSADVLEFLGAKLDCSAAVSRRALDQSKFCFLFAPNYHPGLRHAGPVRRSLKVRTIMNVLGPCVNPAEPPIQLLGVAEEKLIEPVAETLLAMGVGQALVVSGGGIDEIALHDVTHAMRISDGRRERIVIDPVALGVKAYPLEPLKGADPAENAARLRALLQGEGGAAETQTVALNAGALLMIAGLAADLREGVALALDVIRSSAPARVLDAYVEATHA